MADRGFDLEARLAALETADLDRRLAPTDRVAERSYFAHPPGGDLPVLDSEDALVFASNNYLGLTANDRVQDAARRATSTVGTGAGASRLVTGDTMVHHDLERLLAETKGTERALVFSSGYAANAGTITALDPDVVFSDELNHASIVDGCRLSGAEIEVYDHCDVADLRSKLAARAGRRDSGGDGDTDRVGDDDVDTGSDDADGGDQDVDGGGDAPGDTDESWLIVTDTVFSMDGTVAPLCELCDLAEEFGAWTMVDEAHATGLYADGGGVVQAEGLSDRIDVQMGTLSKALASQGGYVAGDDDLIRCLINDARSFVFSTGLAPSAAAAASEALHVARHGDVRERLWGNVSHLRDGLESMGYEVAGDSQILPVIVGNRSDALALADAVRDRGVMAPAIRPPTVPEGTSRIRLTPMATHEPADVVDCLEAFRDAGEEVGLL